jgi:hypothetical protein
MLRCKQKRSTVRLAVEALESRQVLSGTPAPGIVADMAYFNALLDPAQATNVAVQDGDWSAASTWQGGLIPAAGAKVFIPEMIDVVYDAGSSPALSWIRNEGSLSFSDTADQSLLVETITVHHHAGFHIGTKDQPFTHNVTITFADFGPLNTTADPKQLGRGIISEGEVGIYGKQLTTFAPVAVNPAAGSTTISLGTAPLNWNVGDTLLVTGTVPGAHQDEEVVIVGISADKKTYTIDRPLQYNHFAPTGYSAYVANETRTVNFTSQNTTDSQRFGHMMFMMEPTIEIEYAAITHMGRTDKSRHIDDVINFHQNSYTVPGGGTNVRGRYGLHIHRTGLNPANDPVQLTGNFMSDNPGWGFVNHSSNVVMTDNVAYDIDGAAFAAETGGELGSFTHNLAVYQKGGPTIDWGTREGFADWGFSGHGFSLMGGSVALVNNVVSGSAGPAYMVIGVSMQEPGGVGRAAVPVSALRDPSVWNGTTMVNTCVCVGHDCDDPVLPALQASVVPFQRFTGNVAFASYIGVGSYSFRPVVTAKGGNIIDKQVVWGVSGYAMNLDYTDNIGIVNSVLLNSGGYKTAIRTNSSAVNLAIVNTRVEGWTFGLTPSTVGTTRVIGGSWKNNTSIYVGNATSPNRLIEISNVKFGTAPGEKWIDFRLFTNGFSLDNYFSYQGVVKLNGWNIYAPQQAPSAVTFMTLSSLPAGYPKELVGKTNALIMQQYGLAPGGVLAPAIRYSSPFIGGTWARAVTPLPAITMTSPKTAAVDSEYRVIYVDPVTKKSVTAAQPIIVKAGWNIITRVIGGRNRSFLVWGS